MSSEQLDDNGQKLSPEAAARQKQEKEKYAEETFRQMIALHAFMAMYPGATVTEIREIAADISAKFLEPSLEEMVKSYKTINRQAAEQPVRPAASFTIEKILHK